MNTNLNEEKFWIDSYPVQGIKTTSKIPTGTEFYWIDGAPISDLFYRSNQDTGKMFLEFF